MLFGVVMGWFICGVFIRIPIAGHLSCLGKCFMRGYSGLLVCLLIYVSSCLQLVVMLRG